MSKPDFPETNKQTKLNKNPPLQKTKIAGLLIYSQLHLYFSTDLEWVKVVNKLTKILTYWWTDPVLCGTKE